MTAILEIFKAGDDGYRSYCSWQKVVFAGKSLPYHSAETQEWSQDTEMDVVQAHRKTRQKRNLSKAANIHSIPVLASIPYQSGKRQAASRRWCRGCSSWMRFSGREKEPVTIVQLLRAALAHSHRRDTLRLGDLNLVLKTHPDNTLRSCCVIWAAERDKDQAKGNGPETGGFHSHFENPLLTRQFNKKTVEATL